MSQHPRHGWALFSGEIARETAPRPQPGSSTSVDWLCTALFWIERRRQRQRLGELADLNDHLLRDIGVSRDEASNEAAKPFWR
jgi:uncharacterized protein YjiS (DUF1127 family)